MREHFHPAPAWLCVALVACSRAVPRPATIEAPPAPVATPPVDRDAVVANGSCWVLGDDSPGLFQANTRFVYSKGKLKRIEHYDPDRTTLTSAYQYERDVDGRVITEGSTATEGPHIRTEIERDASGRARTRTTFLEGEPVNTFTRTFDDEGHVIVESQGYISKSLHEVRLHWTPLSDGGWTISMDERRLKRGKDETSRAGFETVTVDARGRAISDRYGAVCHRWVWDDRDRCIEATQVPCSEDARGQESVSWTARLVPGDALLAGTRTDDILGHMVTTVREVDENGNLIALRSDSGSETRFEYDGEFRNAACHMIEPDEYARWRKCSLLD